MSGPFSGIPNNRKDVKKQKFTPEDDKKLLALVEKYGLFDWESIANEMDNRTQRQCRDRWNYYLNPDVRNNNWSEKEEKLLLKKYAKYGPKWSLISKFFDNRTDINIKNHYIVMQRRAVRENNSPQTVPMPTDINVMAFSMPMENNTDLFDAKWLDNQYSIEF